MKDYRDMPTVGYWSDMGGVEVKEIQYGIDDYALVVMNALSHNPTSHRLKIYYNSNGEAYIRVHGRRLKLSECMYVFQKVYHRKNNENYV